jgi:hypothetical protein
MRTFAQFSLTSKIVYALNSGASAPGPDGLNIPADFIEVTNRADGPWLGKIYNPATDTFSSPAQTKNDLEFSRVRIAYETWQLWKTTRLEAQARSLAAPIVTALTNRENAAWADHAQALLDWYNAS